MVIARGHLSRKAFAVRRSNDVDHDRDSLRH